MFEFTEEYEPLLREVREMAESVVKPRKDHAGCQDHSDL
jgi:hypothetical protein